MRIVHVVVCVVVALSMCGCIDARLVVKSGGGTKASKEPLQLVQHSNAAARKPHAIHEGSRHVDSAVSKAGGHDGARSVQSGGQTGPMWGSRRKDAMNSGYVPNMSLGQRGAHPGVRGGDNAVSGEGVRGSAEAWSASKFGSWYPFVGASYAADNAGRVFVMVRNTSDTTQGFGVGVACVSALDGTLAWVAPLPRISFFSSDPTVLVDSVGRVIVVGVVDAAGLPTIMYRIDGPVGSTAFKIAELFLKDVTNGEVGQLQATISTEADECFVVGGTTIAVIDIDTMTEARRNTVSDAMTFYTAVTNGDVLLMDGVSSSDPMFGLVYMLNTKTLKTTWVTDPANGMAGPKSYRPHPGAAPNVPNMVNVLYRTSSHGAINQLSPDTGAMTRVMNMSTNAFANQVVTDPWFGWIYVTASVSTTPRRIFLLGYDIINNFLFQLELPEQSRSRVVGVLPNTEHAVGSIVVEVGYNLSSAYFLHLETPSGKILSNTTVPGDVIAVDWSLVSGNVAVSLVHKSDGYAVVGVPISSA